MSTLFVKGGRRPAGVRLVIILCASALVVGLGATSAMAQKQDVRCVQEKLKERKDRSFVYPDPGPADGQLGGRTRTTAEVFQEVATRGLPPLTADTAGEWCAYLSNTDLENALADGWTRLTGDQIRSLYFGETHYWRRPKAADLHGFDYLDEDGNAIITRIVHGDRQEPRREKAAINDDGICFQTGCQTSTSVLQKGDAYRMYAPNSDFVLFVEKFAPGNPEGVK